MTNDDKTPVSKTSTGNLEIQDSTIKDKIAEQEEIISQKKNEVAKIQSELALAVSTKNFLENKLDPYIPFESIFKGEFQESPDSVRPNLYYRQELKEKIQAFLKNHKKGIFVSKIADGLSESLNKKVYVNPVKAAIDELISDGKVKCLNPKKTRGKKYKLTSN